MDLSIFFAAAVLFALGVTVLWVVSLVDALSKPDAQWVAAGQSKIVFILLIVFLGLLGSALYVAIARPALVRVARA